MTLLIAALLTLLVLTSLGVALTRQPCRQVIAMSANGLTLSILFMALQAPDVALSEIVIGSVALPLFFLAARAALRADGARE
jgi:energy-converting hydrogenase B subunit D